MISKSILAMEATRSALRVKMKNEKFTINYVPETVDAGEKRSELPLHLTIVPPVHKSYSPDYHFDYIFKSSNTAVASIDADGTIVAVAPGTATIEAEGKFSNSRATLALTVTTPTHAIIPEKDTIKLSTTETGVAVQFAGEAATIELYAINGILIDKAQAYQSYSRDLDKGVYVIRVNGWAIKFVR